MQIGSKVEVLGNNSANANSKGSKGVVMGRFRGGLLEVALTEFCWRGQMRPVMPGQSLVAWEAALVAI